MLATTWTFWLLMSCGLLISLTSAMPTKSLSSKLYESRLFIEAKSTPQRESLSIGFGTLPKSMCPPSGPSRIHNRRGYGSLPPSQAPSYTDYDPSL